MSRTQDEAMRAYNERMTGNPKGRIAKPPYADMHETKELQPAVVALAEQCGYRVYHVANVKGELRNETGQGFPDLVMVRPNDGRCLVVELKSAGGVVKPKQQQWLVAWACVAAINQTVEVHLWRPAQWHDGTIEEALR